MSIHQETIISATPAAVFHALLSAETFVAMSGGMQAEISPEVGGTIALFGARITGRIIELVEDKRIVQAWRLDDWPAGHYSTVRFELSDEGEKTRISFDQFGYPSSEEAMLEAHWPERYWEPLKAQLSG